ncbi:hypothetical protein [Streptomyces sp. NPDC056527]|uniref:hypothetical protein n=1 Tax=Streptomyces sp. NPDC056527 TaxID=3345853 RepID=UPI0036902A36
MSGRLRSARIWWLDTPRAIRCVVYVSIPLGSLAIGLGVYGDGHGWWDDRSFLTNLASSFASLLFGVPLALVVLTHLSGMQAEVAERRAAHRRTAASVKAFVDAFQDLFTSTERRHTHLWLERLIWQNARLGDLLMQGMAADPAEVETAAANLMALRNRLTPLLSQWAEHLARQWQVIDQECRPLAEAAGLPWIDSRDALALNKIIDDLVSTAPQGPPDASRFRAITSMYTAGLQGERPSTWNRANAELHRDVNRVTEWFGLAHDISLTITGQRLPTMRS